MEAPADDAKHRQACINDLISVLALPAIWTGHGPPHVLRTLLDALLGMFRIQLQQVMLNLVLNGIEAMTEVSDQSRELAIRAEPYRLEEGSAVLVAIQDAGIGLSPESRERAFDVFYTTKSQGLGMGLSISRSIIQGHGGRLWATANPRHGATFQFVLPCAALPVT
jgi:signal transduction histidine kinase